jgi:hypothetical protein
MHDQPRRISSPFYRRPEGFWGEEAKRIYWHKPPPENSGLLQGRPSSNGLSAVKPIFVTTPLTGHLQDRPDQPALVYISTEVNETKVYTYRELYREVNRCAAVLQELGVKKGDRVIVYMPMIAEATIAMLACVRLGAIHSVVFGGFASANLAVRIDDAKPKLMITSDAGMRGGKPVPYKHLVDESIRLSKFPPEKVLLCNRGSGQGHEAGGRPRCRLRHPARQAYGSRSAGGVAGVQRTELHPLHVRHHGYPQGVSSATLVVTQWRWRRPCSICIAAIQARRCSLPPTSAGWLATPISSTPR